MMRTIILSLLLTALVGQVSTAQQDDDVLLLDVDSRLTSGRPNFDGSWSLGTRSFLGRFDSISATRDPGWNTLGSGSPAMPAGADAPPADTDLEWDFLPIKINEFASNLLYWDGTGTVNFGALPAEGYELSLQSKSVNDFVAADGSAELVTGSVIDKTDDIGSIHRHRFWFLDDGDEDFDTDPQDGVYLLSVRTRMEGIDRSRPLFFMFGTLDTPALALEQSKTWVDDFLEDLSPDYAADFDGDLQVNGSDLQTWQLGFGLNGEAALQVNGDANFDQSINGADFLGWQRQVGSQLSNFEGVSSSALLGSAIVPEPTSLALLAFGLMGSLTVRRSRTDRGFSRC